MVGKYLKDIGVKREDIPKHYFPFDKRQFKWAKERRKYGFDSRETWSLDYTFALWIYERLMMYKEVNCIDTDFHTYKSKGETLTFTQCIDKMIEGFKIKAKDSYVPGDEDWQKIDDAFKLFGLCHNSLWW